MTLLDTISDILVQKVSKCVFAVVRPPDASPSASTTALMLPAPVAVIPSKVSRSSSSKRSSTPQVKAPWLPPPCSARLIAFGPSDGLVASTDLGRAVMARLRALVLVFGRLSKECTLALVNSVPKQGSRPRRGPMSVVGLGRVKTKSDLVVMPSGRQ